MLKTVGAVAFAAILAGWLTGFSGGVEPVSATPSVDVVPIAAPTCPDRGWPYRDCATGSATPVRVITTDRLH